MREVPKPAITPMRCAALPHLGQMAVNERWLDTGSEMLASGVDQHVYLSATAIRQGMVTFGWKTPLEVEALERKLAEAEETITVLEQRMKDAEEALRAIDVLESFEFRARRKPGRKPAEAMA